MRETGVGPVQNLYTIVCPLLILASQDYHYTRMRVLLLFDNLSHDPSQVITHGKVHALHSCLSF